MPTYDYLCEKCGFEFEREQRITADPIKTCPECKARKVKRLLSAPGFILKGGGWYADGYGSSGKSKKSDESSTGSDKKTGGDGGSESKSKSKSESKDSSKKNSTSASDSSGSGGSGTKASKAGKSSD